MKALDLAVVETMREETRLGKSQVAQGSQVVLVEELDQQCTQEWGVEALRLARARLTRGCPAARPRTRRTWSR